MNNLIQTGTPLVIKELIKEQVIELAENILIKRMYGEVIWEEHPNGDFIFTEKAQDIFNELVDQLEGVVYDKT